MSGSCEAETEIKKSSVLKELIFQPESGHSMLKNKYINITKELQSQREDHCFGKSQIGLLQRKIHIFLQAWCGFQVATLAGENCFLSTKVDSFPALETVGVHFFHCCNSK